MVVPAAVRCPRHVLQAVALLLASAAAAAQAASATAGSAVGCGQAGENRAGPAAAVLALDTQNSKAKLDFEDGTYTDSLRLIFRVSGCVLQDAADGVDARVRASGRAQAAFAKPSVSAKGTLLVIEIPVDAKRFSVGAHDAAVTVFGRAVDEVVLGVTVQRKQPPALPSALAGAAVVSGFLWALFSAWIAIGGADGKKVKFKAGYLLVAFAGAAGAGYAVFEATYIDAAVWVPDFSSTAALAIATLAAAAGGATAGPVAKGAVAAVRRRRAKPTSNVPT